MPAWQYDRARKWVHDLSGMHIEIVGRLCKCLVAQERVAVTTLVLKTAV
ncbi:MAG TPA: hypothetical protein VJ180_13320 [Pyrinomonadaceae bacterium]|nr:hypothetical protein [Pyrinomonadaceae bacterium]